MNKYKSQSRKSQKKTAKDRRRHNMCESKTRYETESDAFQKGQVSYFCGYCKGWHRSGQIGRIAASLKNGKGAAKS
jgi:hypothetical protein